MADPARHTTVEAACLGKHPFGSPKTAQKVASKRKGNTTFRCPHCGFWHLTHTIKRPKAWRRPTGEI